MSTDRRPTPNNDSLLAKHSKGHTYEWLEQHVFGFDSEEQLSAWFSEDDLDRLKALGVSINVYEVPAKYVLKGDHQVAFLKEKARLVHPAHLAQAA